MSHGEAVPAAEAFRRLTEGNARFLKGDFHGDASASRRKDTAENGQHPYAIIVTCADSRVVPEFIFSAGIGELFVIRTAGNTVSDCSLGSIEYAIAHLGVRLVVVMGHSCCGAVTAAVEGNRERHISNITDTIQEAVNGETDICEACMLNIHHSLRRIEDDLPDRHDVRYVGAVYDIESGEVEFFDDLMEE